MNHLPFALISLTATVTAIPMKHMLFNQIRDIPLVRKPYRGSRELQLSDECLAATQANEENPIFYSALLDAMNACPEATIFTPTSLTMDYSDCPSYTEGIKEACDAVNGKISA